MCMCMCMCMCMHMCMCMSRACAFACGYRLAAYGCCMWLQAKYIWLQASRALTSVWAGRACVRSAVEGRARAAGLTTGWTASCEPPRREAPLLLPLAASCPPPAALTTASAWGAWAATAAPEVRQGCRHSSSTTRRCASIALPPLPRPAFCLAAASLLPCALEPFRPARHALLWQEACWAHCSERAGGCSGFCGSDGACCRRGDSSHADGVACNHGVAGCTNEHCCVHNAVKVRCAWERERGGGGGVGGRVRSGVRGWVLCASPWWQPSDGQASCPQVRELQQLVDLDVHRSSARPGAAQPPRKASTFANTVHHSRTANVQLQPIRPRTLYSSPANSKPGVAPPRFFGARASTTVGVKVGVGS